MKSILIGVVLSLVLSSLSAQRPVDSIAVRGFAIAAPSSDGVDAFITFMQEVLAPANINTLVLRVDYNYAYESHPELREEAPLSKAQVSAMVSAARDLHMEIVPQINLLGHQSWASTSSKLLEVYPQFDETPEIALPAEYKWPNDDGLYCKSYCPLHPEVHDVVFALVDEIMEVFEARQFHAGMDEVFYIAHEQCPRCHGRDPAVLFAEEVRRIRNHLHARGQRLWIWGDRLIDGKTTGIGMWEASMNNTHQAIDMIPRDVVICDWHYERAEPTAAYFAVKGFDVITCPWNQKDVAAQQYAQYIDFQETAHPTLAARYLGLMQTVWTSAGAFQQQYDSTEGLSKREQGQVDCFKTLCQKINGQ